MKALYNHIVLNMRLYIEVILCIILTCLFLYNCKIGNETINTSTILRDTVVKERILIQNVVVEAKHRVEVAKNKYKSQSDTLKSISKITDDFERLLKFSEAAVRDDVDY